MSQRDQDAEAVKQWLSAPLVAFPEGQVFRLPMLVTLTSGFFRRDEQSLGPEFEMEQGQRVRLAMASSAASRLIAFALILRAEGPVSVPAHPDPPPGLDG